MKKIYFLLLALSLFTSVNAQIINFPDVNFKAKLLSSSTNNYTAGDLNYMNLKIDANNDGEIEISEALQVGTLNITYSSISSLDGIQYFTNLKEITCYNNLLNNLDVSMLSNLKQLFCDNNQLTSLNISGLNNLTRLVCYNNNLVTLNASGLTSLEKLQCFNNHMVTLDVSGAVSLQNIECNDNVLNTFNTTGATSLNMVKCDNNQLTSLNFEGLTNLVLLRCSNNNLTSLNISNAPILSEIFCSNNQLTSLNTNGLPSLSWFYCNNNQLATLEIGGSNHQIFLNCSNNQLTSLNIKNGVYEENLLNFSGNTNLHYICADENQISQLQTKITEYGYSNCEINTYCSFAPGGSFYTIQGNSKYDINNDGCGVLDIPTSNLKFSINNGTDSGFLVSDNVGYYDAPVTAGTHIITPIIENPTYFTISPATTSVTFPTQSSPFNQDFCLTANGTHSDLEIVLMPISDATPGMDASWLMIYRNKGTNIQSGTITYTFDDAISDFVSANPNIANQTVNNLTWNFSNLQPFETRTIMITLNLNSPTETPPLIMGSELNFVAAINGLVDESPNDNIFNLHQYIVSSYDPNDKTCLEGATIAPSEVGKFVHYMIRFENTGTANARNIVVKDIIDAAKFDVTSLVPIKESHDFVTRIDGNKVEFIFENINLPFDDANNDGYVVFKIKTKPTLVNGNTFSNTASIYFDYNFPIVTNTATTTIQALSVQDFNFSTYFNLYPNPVQDVLTISTKENIEITSINIYNTLGQLVLVIPNAKSTKTVDVSSLTSGNYFIKINSDKGTSNTKFIKN